MSARDSLQLPGETSGSRCHRPVVSSACAVIPAKQGCGGFIHGASERHGLDAWAAFCLQGPSLEALHAPGSRHISQDCQVLLLLALIFLTPASPLLLSIINGWPRTFRGTEQSHSEGPHPRLTQSHHPVFR